VFQDFRSIAPSPLAHNNVDYRRACRCSCGTFLIPGVYPSTLEVTLRVRSLHDRQLRDARRAWVLLGAAAALLLIACTNVAAMASTRFLKTLL
jgi:hypothetical protein